MPHVYHSRQYGIETSINPSEGIDLYNPLPPEDVHEGTIFPVDEEKVKKYAKRPAAAIALQELTQLGEERTKNTPMYFARLLQQELPTRFAHRIMDIKSLARHDRNSGSWQAVQSCYEQSFFRLLSTKAVVNLEDEIQFRQMIASLKTRHRGISQQIAMALQELNHTSSNLTREATEDTMFGTPANSFEVAPFLDKFYTSRLAIRVLTGQYMALMEDEGKQQQASKIGLIDRQCCPGMLAQSAANDAAALATYYYGHAPEVEILGATNLQFAYMPAHLRYVLFELLKNSIRATIEKHPDSDRLPPVKVVVAEGEDEIAIKISDQGGGFRRDGLNRIWSYTYTTAASEVLAPDSSLSTAPMAGFGHGLPLSRLYARFWGGDLAIMSMEGFGTDAYIHLCKLGKRQEFLPY